MNPIILAAIGVGGSTLLGSIIGFFIKNVSHKVNDAIIGLCAGVMLSAAVLGLMLPAFEQVPVKMIWLPIVGVFAGAMLLNLLDTLTPHLHNITGLDREEHINNKHLNRVLLFVLAIALHKFPEGMAAGVGFSGGEGSMDGSAWSVALAVSLQNIPEGMVIISPLLVAGVSRWRTLLIALCIGLLEVLGVFAGYYLAGIAAWCLPFMLALSGGSMLYVVSDEMIPESHAHGYEKLATYALLAGFLIMLLIENILV